MGEEPGQGSPSPRCSAAALGLNPGPWVGGRWNSEEGGGETAGETK